MEETVVRWSSRSLPVTVAFTDVVLIVFRIVFGAIIESSAACLRLGFANRVMCWGGGKVWILSVWLNLEWVLGFWLW